MRRAHLLWGGIALGAAVVVFALVWFQPQKLVIDQRVNEAAPLASASTSGSAPPLQRTVAAGSFRSLEHQTTGQASLVRLPDGSTVLRLDDLNTSNGPDLRVYLSELPATLDDRDYGTKYVELGKLKGNIGDQNYRVPTSIDLDRYRSAVIWCVRFKVGFGVAPLDRT